jgi:hypothetical protein
MGDQEWVAVGEMWEPTHCDLVVELADIVDDLLTETLPGTTTGLRIDVGLRELPPVVSALLAAGLVAPPPVESASVGRILSVTPALRALGPTVCVAVGRGRSCRSAVRELGTLSAPLTVGALASSGARHALTAVSRGAFAGYFAPLRRLGQVQAAAQITGLVRSREVLGQSGHAPRAAARFGEQ